MLRDNVVYWKTNRKFNNDLQMRYVSRSFPAKEPYD